MNKEQILKIIDRKYSVINEETKVTGVCLRLNKVCKGDISFFWQWAID